MSRTGSVLVTGGAGFIGGHLVQRLVSTGARARVLDDFSAGDMRSLGAVAGDVEVIRGDVRDRSAVDEAVAGADCIVHLAAQTSVPASVADPDFTMEVNVRGTRNVLEAGAKAGARRVVFASSCAVYGNPSSVPVPEEATMEPLSPYAESKMLGEVLCARFGERFSGGATVLRLFNVYGPRPAGAKHQGVIDSFAESVSRGERPVVNGDGTQTRDFVHVADVCAAMELAMSSPPPGGVFNVGTGVETPLLELVSAVQRALGARPAMPAFAPPRPGDVLRTAADVRRSRRRLGFSASVPLEEGLRTISRGMTLAL